MEQLAGNLQIIGENSLMNELLAAYLKEAVGADCSYCARLEEAAGVRVSQAENRVTLIDCYAMPRDALIQMLESAPLRKLARWRPTLFNLHPDPGIEQAAIASGVRGFFYLDDPPSSFVRGIHALFSDEYWISRKTLVNFLSTPTQGVYGARLHPELTLRESELMNLLSKGLSNQAIADQLFISIPTVKSHLSSIYRKIKVNNRLQAVCWAEKALANSGYPPQV